MNRLLYLDKKSDEIKNLLSGKKNSIMRAANIKKYPYQMINRGYRVFFKNNDTEGIIVASAQVKEAIFLENTNTTSKQEVEAYLSLTYLRKQKKDYIRKRKYVSIFILEDVKEEKLLLDNSLYGIEDDWMRFKRIED